MNYLLHNPIDLKIILLAGYPISGVVSPIIFNKIFDICNLNAIAIPVEVKKGELPEFIRTAKYLKCPGVILTMPHKQDIISLVDEVDEQSRMFKSVNAVKIDEKGSTRGNGFDGKGVVEALLDSGAELSDKEAVIIGAGGIGSITACELAKKGVKKITILNRTLERAESLAHNLKNLTDIDVEIHLMDKICNAVKSADILVQATSLGMKGSGSDFEDLTFLENLKKEACVIDVVANPPETALIKRAGQLGIKTVFGIDIIICQLQILCELFLDAKIGAEAKKMVKNYVHELFKGMEA